jgi:peptidoglycan/LPS O-acetylase OafA/YrhL
MKYRSDIDGLRALAVVPVILYHAKVPFFSGGYVGVDVFFVISGYLITNIILNDIKYNSFSIYNFYERRMRRILPALFFVALTTLPFAWLWLLPSDAKDFSTSLVAISVFASNLTFWRTSGYFDTASELKPLIHTWSLAVEEQYYHLFPLFAIITRRWLIWRTFSTLIIIAFFSLLFAQWCTIRYPAAAFYLLPTRAWELLIGVLISYYYSDQKIKKHSYRMAESGSLLGFFMIVLSIFRS